MSIGIKINYSLCYLKQLFAWTSRQSPVDAPTLDPRLYIYYNDSRSGNPKDGNEEISISLVHYRLVIVI
jgi:hypothetical protein